MEKPLISFVLLAYNQEQFIREAVEGALSQTYSPLEIILSDDCSTDQTYAIMSDMAHAYKGPHTVHVRKNSTNLGLAGNYNAAVEMSSGDIIVQAAGDDVSLPERVMKTCHSFLADPEIYGVSTDMDMVDENGVFMRRCVVPKIIRSIDLHRFINLERKTLIRPVHDAAFAYRKTLFNEFGPLLFRSAETTPMLFRCLLMGKKIDYIDDMLVKYRMTRDNISMITINDFRTNEKKQFSKRKARLDELFLNNLQQMRHDLQSALSAGLIDQATASKLEDNLGQVEQSSIRRRNFYNNRNLIKWVTCILFAKEYSLKEKVTMYLEGGRLHRFCKYAKACLMSKRASGSACL